MRFFFRSRQFKIIASVLAAVIIISAVFGVVGGVIAPQSDLLGTIAAPFQSFATSVSDRVKDFISVYTDGNALMLENAELSSQLNELRGQLADYNEAIAQNEFYKNYLEIKDENPDFKFTPATRISSDAGDPYGGFVINKGSVAGIAAHDPVITDAGLVGYISEVGLTTSKVTSILSADLTLGALDNRTNDSGILSGNVELADKKLCRFYNLSRSCNVAIGDYVVSSGEGIFPDGLLIGTIESIGSDKYNTSIYATVKPFADFSDIRGVMVITSFDGQGGLIPGEGSAQ